MTVETILPPAEVLAVRCEARWPGESAEYRVARTALLAEEIARHHRMRARLRSLMPGLAVAIYQMMPSQHSSRAQHRTHDMSSCTRP